MQVSLDEYVSLPRSRSLCLSLSLSCLIVCSVSACACVYRSSATLEGALEKPSDRIVVVGLHTALGADHRVGHDTLHAHMSAQRSTIKPNLHKPDLHQLGTVVAAVSVLGELVSHRPQQIQLVPYDDTHAV